MEQLREIMGNFTEIEHDLEAFSLILESLEDDYISKGKSELAMNVHFYGKVVECSKKELSKSITKIERYLLEHK